MEKFQTVIIEPSIQKIYSFSDIHADIDSLIIALRDCAKVIIKKPDFGYVAGKADENLNQLCNIDISESDNGFIDDLNYDWNPEAHDTYVVIVGDILDGTRTTSYSSGMTRPHYKPQIEIKILRFINSLMIKAKEHNSRLIKLLGNHEILNMAEDKGPEVIKYMFREDSELVNYYRRSKRLDTFKSGNPGYDLLMENGNGIFIKINNNMFIHGQLVKSMDLRNYVSINNFLNDPSNGRIIDPATGRAFNYVALLRQLGNGAFSPLWMREYGDDTKINNRINDRTQVSFCDDVRSTFETIFSGIRDIDISKLRLIIGHCPQHYSTFYGTLNKTFTNASKSPDGVTEFYDPPSNVGKFNTQANMIFGITMECDKRANEKPDDHYIYRVDVGSSRAFDQSEESNYAAKPNCDDAPDKADCETNPNSHVYFEKMVLGSRTVQVLELSGESLGNVRIIKSTIKNTRINQPRDFYENTIKETAGLSLDNDYYKQKYLKYKNKYLQLKKIK